MSAEVVAVAQPEEAELSHELSFGQFADTLGFVLRLAQISSFSRVYAQLPPDTPLRLGEYTILLAILHNPGVRQGMIADGLRIKWSNMTKIMRSLEERGYIHRRVSERDRRSFELELTALGSDLLDQIIPLMRDADLQSRAMLSPDEDATLIALLRKVIRGPSPARERAAG